MIVRSTLASMVILATTAGGARGQVPASADTGSAAAPTISRVEFRINPLMDLMMYARVLAEQGDSAEVPAVEGMAAAVAAARATQEELGGWSGWGLFTGPASSCTSAAEMIDLSGQLPEEFTSRSGQTFALRHLCATMAAGMAEAEPGFLRELWPQREAMLQRTAKALRAMFEPKGHEIYAYIQEKLGTEHPQAIIPVYLVVDGAAPGSVTYRTRRGAVCFVGVNAMEGSQLMEAVIHETLHALDTSTAREGNVFSEIRAALAEAGVPRDDPRMHDLPHMVMFVQAAETVRRLIDPAHVDYGEMAFRGRRPLYERDASSVAAVRPAWRAYLDGTIDGAEAVRRMVETATLPAP